MSLTLHAALLLGLSMLPARHSVQARPVPVPRDSAMILGENGGGEVHFCGTSEPGGVSLQPVSPAQPEKPKPSTEPAAPFPATTDGPGRLGSAGLPTKPGKGTTDGPGSGGSGGTTSFFQVEARGQRIVYVIDFSASMGKNGALQAARRELLHSLRKLPEAGRFQIVTYNSQAQFLLPRYPGWLAPTPEILEEAALALAKIPAEGRTEHAPALQKALSLQPDIVFFLTDADDLKQEHLRLANLLNRGRAVIHTIELTLAHRDRIGMPLQILARDNRGLYQAVDLEHYRNNNE